MKRAHHSRPGTGGKPSATVTATATAASTTSGKKKARSPASSSSRAKHDKEAAHGEHGHRSRWMVCPRCCVWGDATTNKRLEQWTHKVRQFFVGELPASLSLRTKIRIVLEARLLGHLWMIFQIVITLVSCTYFAITSAYKRDAVGLFIEENAFGVSVLADLLLRFYASDHR